MVKVTKSLAHWLHTNYPTLLPLIMFGHIELFTDDMRQEYRVV